MRRIFRRKRAALLALHILTVGALAAPVPALAMQILDAADHGELVAEISATNVNRIALAGDRIAKVVRSPDGYAVEHDAASGDIYLRPAGAQPGTPAAEASGFEPVTLFIGTEKGFTYRLTLMPAARASAQILIRNADAVPAAASVPVSSSEPHVAALVRLVRAVTRREPLPGYRVANAAAAYRGAVIDQEMDALAEAVALDVMQVWITDLHRAVEERASTLDIADGEQLQKWREGLRANRVALARHRHQGLQRLNTALAVVEKLRLIETELAGALNHKGGEVLLDDGKGGRVAWKPEEIGGRRGGSEVYRAEEIELRAGDRIRWTRNDAGLGLVNSRTAEVVGIVNGRVTFRLEDGKTLQLGKGDPQLRHLDHAWASTVHAFQGRTVDNVIAAMEARHPHLTTQKSFYVEISRARDRAELVTDDAAELRAQLQEATGERIAALEGIGEIPRHEPAKAADSGAVAAKDNERTPPDGRSRTERGAEEGAGKAPQNQKSPAREPETPVRERGKGGMDLGL